MLPNLIPYYIRKENYINLETGERQYEHKYYARLYDVKSEKIIKLNLSSASYIDRSLKTSCSLLISKDKYTPNYRQAIINKIEDLDSPLWFEDCTVISPQLILVKKNNKYGIVDDKISIRQFFEFDKINVYTCNLNDFTFIIASKNGRYGVLKENMQELIPFEHENITCNLLLGLLVFSRNNITTIFDIQTKSKKIEIPLKIDSIQDISENCIIVEKSKKYNVFDMDTSRLISDIWFTEIDKFENGFSLCNGQYILKKDGTLIKMSDSRGLRRSKDIVYNAKPLTDNLWEIKVFKEDNFITKFTHNKRGYGIFSYKMIGEKYFEIGSFSDKRDCNFIEAYYDIYGNNVSKDVVMNYKNNLLERNPIIRELGTWNRYHEKNPEGLIDVDIEEFDWKHFPNSHLLKNAEYGYELRELAPNLLSLEIAYLDDDTGRLYWRFVGYIYKDINLWANIIISNE